MTFKRYFSKDFPKDLATLQLGTVPQVLRDIFHDPDLLCFGGKDWKHVTQDLELIAVHDRPRFVLSLLAMVLTDLEMPEMDGFTLTRNIKQDARFHGLPVVIHSSLSGSANEDHVRSVGADGYVAKFVAEDLADTIRRVLPK